MRVVVVGAGFMGSTHIRAWQRIPGVELAGVVSSKQELTISSGGNLSASDTPLDLAHLKRYTLEEAFNDPTIDAMDLCVPTFLHEAMTLSAFLQGKHVIVEKPMALSEQQCSQMIASAQGAGRLLMAAHVIRFWGDYQPLMEAVRSGTLGRLRSLDLRRQCATPTWGAGLTRPTISGGGAFDLLIHDVDLCIALLGMPEAVSARGSMDHLAATLHYGDTDSVTISGGWHTASSYPFSMSYEARFDEGTMGFSSLDRPVALYRASGDVEHPAGTAVDAFESELAYFAECVRSGHPVDRCPPQDSAAAVRLLRLLLQSCEERGKIIECM